MTQKSIIKRNLTDEVYLAIMDLILSMDPCYADFKQPAQITNKIFLGSQANAESWKILDSLSVTHVLNCAGYKGPRKFYGSPYEGLNIEYMEIKAEDTDCYDITRHFNEAFSYIDKAVQMSGGRILVHCAMGINRSGAICLGYLMQNEGLTLLKATRTIKRKRKIFLTNIHFRALLIKFGRQKNLLENGDDITVSNYLKKIYSGGLKTTNNSRRSISNVINYCKSSLDNNNLNNNTNCISNNARNISTNRNVHSRPRSVSLSKIKSDNETNKVINTNKTMYISKNPSIVNNLNATSDKTRFNRDSEKYDTMDTILKFSKNSYLPSYSYIDTHIAYQNPYNLPALEGFSDDEKYNGFYSNNGINTDNLGIRYDIEEDVIELNNNDYYRDSEYKYYNKLNNYKSESNADTNRYFANNNQNINVHNNNNNNYKLATIKNQNVFDKKCDYKNFYQNQYDNSLKANNNFSYYDVINTKKPNPNFYNDFDVFHNDISLRKAENVNVSKYIHNERPFMDTNILNDLYSSLLASNNNETENKLNFDSDGFYNKLNNNYNSNNFYNKPNYYFTNAYGRNHNLLETENNEDISERSSDIARSNFDILLKLGNHYTHS